MVLVRRVARPGNGRMESQATPSANPWANHRVPLSDLKTPEAEFTGERKS